MRRMRANQYSYFPVYDERGKLIPTDKSKKHGVAAEPEEFRFGSSLDDEDTTQL